MASEQVAVAARGDGPRGVGSHVRAALLLGHGHPGQQAGLAVGSPQPGVVGPGGEQRREAGRQRGLVPQRRDGGIGHGDGAAVPGLGLRPHVEPGRPRHVRPGRVIQPRRPVQALADRGGHKLVPGRMELDLVDAMAVPVVRAQHRRMLVREPGQFLGLGGARAEAELVQPAHRVLTARPALPALRALPALVPGGGLPPQGLKQRRIVGHVAGQQGDLIDYLVRHVRHRAGHENLPSPIFGVFRRCRERARPWRHPFLPNIPDSSIPGEHPANGLLS